MQSPFKNPRSNIIFSIGLLLSFATMTTTSISVIRSGVLPITPGDVAITFYSTVTNQDAEPFLVRMDMVQCCLELPNNSSECKAMQLHGGLAVLLQPKASYNLSMYFVNHYLSRRKGKCTLKLLSWKASDVSENQSPASPESTSEINISFNTEVEQPNIFRRLFLNFFSRSQDFDICGTVEQDSSMNCKEANCLMEYSGFRSIYSEESKSCEPTPTCSDKMMISPATGKCRKMYPQKLLHSSMLPEMKSAEVGVGLELEMGKAKEGSEKSPASKDDQKDSDDKPAGVAMLASIAPKVTCVHGKQDGIGCICDEGWISKTLEETSGSGPTSSYQMCDVITPEGDIIEKSGKRKASIMVLIILFILLILLIIWCIWKRKNKNNGYEKLSNDNSEDEEPAENVISEITGRREGTHNTVTEDPQLENEKPTEHDSSNVTSSQSIPHIPSDKPSDTGWSNAENFNKLEITSLASEIVEPSVVVLKEVTPSSTLDHASISFTELNPHSGSQHLDKSYETHNNSTAAKPNLDTILSLTDSTELRSRSDLILRPKTSVNPRRYTSVDLSHLSLQSNNVSKPDIESAPPQDEEENLASQLRKEEWDKFLKACSDNAASRKRSLCTTEEFEHENDLRPGCNLAAKVKSVPAMSFNPFKIKDASHSKYQFQDKPSQIRTPPTTTFNQNPLSKKSSNLSISIIEEEEERNDAFSFLQRLSDKVRKVSSPESSATSIWSTVASENAFEPDTVSICSKMSSLEDLTDFGNMTLIENVFDESSSQAEEIINRNDSLPKATLPEYATVKETKSVSETKFLTAAERIQIAAKLHGYKDQAKEKSEEDEFVLESDLIPSEIFRSKSKETSAANSQELFWMREIGNSESQSSNIGRPFAGTNNFWDQDYADKIVTSKKNESKNIYDELDPYRITSELKDVLKASKAKSVDSGLNMAKIKGNYKNDNV